MPTDSRSRVKSHEPEVLRRSGIDHFVDIQSHTVAENRQFIHQRDVDGPEDVLKHLGHFSDSRSEEHTSELQSPCNLVCRLLLEKKNSTHRLSKADGADLRLDVRYARGARLYIWFRRTAKNLV